MLKDIVGMSLQFLIKAPRAVRSRIRNAKSFVATTLVAYLQHLVQSLDNEIKVLTSWESGRKLKEK